MTEQKPEEKLPPTTQDRMQACAKDVQKVLEKHKCRIVPYIMPPEMIGDMNTKCLMQASFGIMPLE